tara:strand:- start:2685 stop:2807 length:123 start_codon:yes stop_codon:yes gene_type:complete
MSSKAKKEMKIIICIMLKTLDRIVPMTVMLSKRPLSKRKD